MGIAERRQREREELRAAIIDAAADIVSTLGVDALSLRAVAERIEYSHATIYLYFEGKDALLRAVVNEAFERFDAMLSESHEEHAHEGPIAQLAAARRAYVDYALEHTSYFKLMFAIPGVARLGSDRAPSELTIWGQPLPRRDAWTRFSEAMRTAIESGAVPYRNVEDGLYGFWATAHGLVTLYMAGHLDHVVRGAEQLDALIARVQPLEPSAAGR